MNIRAVFRFLAAASASVTAAMIVPLAWGLVTGEGLGCALPFLYSIGAGLALSGIFAHFGMRASFEDMQIREAMLAVVLSWVVAGVTGGLPYIFSGVLPDVLNAVFEGVSGFTATGATVIANLRVVPRSILFWRSFTQWLGGLGIIVFMIALLPMSDAAMRLYKAEMPGPVHDRLAPRMQQTAILLWRVYFVLTVAQVLLLMLGGLDLFDSITLTFSTVATGGFSPYHENVGHFHGNYVKIVTAVFLFLSGSNFTLYYFAIAKKSVRPLSDNPEFRFYVKIFLVFGLLTSIILYKDGIFGSVQRSLFEGFFHTISTLSTCGFFISDYNLWPSPARLLMLLLMFCGGCAISTASGITCARMQIITQHVKDEFFRKLHPRAMRPTRLGDTVIDAWVVSGCFAFFAAYIGIFTIGFLTVTLMGLDMDTALSGVAATLGNFGPGFGMVGPSQSYALLPDGVKITYIILMLCGRLEIFTLLAIFTKMFRKP